MSDRYILNDEGEPVAEPDLLTWARWFETSTTKRILAQDSVGEQRVSTVFLGLDHSFGGPTPILWETMIFGGPHDQHQERYATRSAAVEGHARAVKLAREALS